MPLKEKLDNEHLIFYLRTSRPSTHVPRSLVEGKAKGMQMKNMENARKMKKLGLGSDLIQQVTNLSAEEIEILEV